MVGPIESGVLRTGEEVEICDDHKLITTARAHVDIICSPDADARTIGLLLGDVDRSRLAPGQTIRRTVAPK